MLAILRQKCQKLKSDIGGIQKSPDYTGRLRNYHMYFLNNKHLFSAYFLYILLMAKVSATNYTFVLVTVLHIKQFELKQILLL